ncbi:MAG: selenide, water dikinase SelD [Bacteroidetes bacterium]|nr:selenide, water dikinase SelD [Bacteroidota bacterium]
MLNSVKLTQYSTGGGCGCKINPVELKNIIKGIVAGSEFPNLIVGNNTADDASVFDLKNGKLLIQTADFFMPIVDDPYIYGQIAAANAISDVYAMGGKPVMANALLGFPSDKLPAMVANAILKGAQNICKSVNIPLAGGHSIKTNEPIFGLSVTGITSKKHLKTNSNAKENDIIYITKPLGTGILATALKREKLSRKGLKNLIKYTTKVNTEGLIFGKINYINSMTDITGFGLLGHLSEMCNGAKLGAELYYNKIPVISEVWKCIEQKTIPGNTAFNYQNIEKKVKSMPIEFIPILNDPQTNGGLMIAVDENKIKTFEKYCFRNNISIYKIGKFVKDKNIKIVQL